jgi:hypothetical protein
MVNTMQQVGGHRAPQHARRERHHRVHGRQGRRRQR